MNSGVEQLSYAVALCGRALGKEEEQTAPLRALQKVSRAATHSASNGYIRSVAFILDTWIADFYYNFAGDIVSPNWEQAHIVREQLIRTRSAMILKQLAEAISEESAGATWLAVQELIASYLEAVEVATRAVQDQ